MTTSFYPVPTPRPGRLLVAPRPRGGDWLAGELRTAGRTVLVHCRQGIGRAGTVAVAVLAAAGVPFPDAIQWVSAARGRPVPETDDQRTWLAAATRTTEKP